jgi:predicted Zn finger-like uncharacterized protein
MRIDCPDCAAAYEVPDRLLTGRKTVRCARCGTEWIMAPPLPDESQSPSEIKPVEILDRPPVTEHRGLDTFSPAQDSRHRSVVTAMERLVQTARPPSRPSFWPTLGWIISIVLIACLAWGTIAWRTEVMRVWPPSTRLYIALGLVHPAP